MKNLTETQNYLQTIADTMNLLDSQRDVFQLLIDFGQEFDSLQDTSQATIVPGCLSKVWVETSTIDGRVQINGAAEALIVRGYVAILATALSGLTTQDVAQTESLIQDFIQTSKITQSALPTRANAFPSIYESIKMLTL